MEYQANSQTQAHRYTVICLLQYVTRCLYLPHDIKRLNPTDSNVIPVIDLSVQYIQLPTLLRDNHSKETGNLILTQVITLQQDITDSYITSGRKCSLTSEKSNVA